LGGFSTSMTTMISASFLDIPSRKLHNTETKMKHGIMKKSIGNAFFLSTMYYLHKRCL